MILNFKPIKVWPDGWQDPRRHESREGCQFTATYNQTLQLLDREVTHLRARSVTLQVDASDRDCRLDGQLRANAKVDHPGVILTLDTPEHGALVYATDRFRASSVWSGAGSRSVAGWQNNLRAVALGLEALRKVERYGIAERGQQYAGYREIGTGIALGPAQMTVEQAARILLDCALMDATEADHLIGDAGRVRAAYQQAAKYNHPDTGGDADVFRTLTAARDVLLGVVVVTVPEVTPRDRRADRLAQHPSVRLGAAGPDGGGAVRPAG